jgi:hypothetical protein
MISVGHDWAPVYACLQAVKTADVDTMNMLSTAAPAVVTLLQALSCNNMLNTAGAHMAI